MAMKANNPEIFSRLENAAAIPVVLLDVGSKPVRIFCPFCDELILTKPLYKTSRFTHIVALFLGIFFWWLCCCIIPYYTNRWKNVEHYCPNPKCKQFLGFYSRRSMIV